MTLATVCVGRNILFIFEILTKVHSWFASQELILINPKMEPRTRFLILMQSVNKCFTEKNSACDYQYEILVKLIKRRCYNFFAQVNAQGLLWTEDIGQSLLSALLKEFPTNDRESLSPETLDQSICDFVRGFYESKITQRREPLFAYLYFILIFGVLQTFIQFHGFSEDRRTKFIDHYSSIMLISMNKNLEQQYDHVKGMYALNCNFWLFLAQLPEDAPMNAESLHDFPQWLSIDGGIGTYNRMLANSLS